MTSKVPGLVRLDFYVARAVVINLSFHSQNHYRTYPRRRNHQEESARSQRSNASGFPYFTYHREI